MSAPVKKARRRASRGSGEELHGEIIEATKRLLAESASADAVSIRAVADSVGVTPPSMWSGSPDSAGVARAEPVDVPPAGTGLPSSTSTVAGRPVTGVCYRE